MNGLELDPVTYTLYLVGFTALLGLFIYLFFYELFQRYGGRRVAGIHDNTSLSPVMSGFIVEKPVFPSAREIMIDILYRSWRRISRLLSRSAHSIYHDWYFWAYVLLVITSLIALLWGVVK